jgi:crossover junction endodeoxyribonuclease RuvC
MRILGIDPGLSLTGYGCVDLGTPTLRAGRTHGSESRGTSEFALIEAGVFRLKSKASIAHRLGQLHDDLITVLDELKPHVMVVEKLFTHYKHVRTGILMAHARGVVLLAGQMRGVQIQELAVTEVKRAVTGNGHASKQQMQHAVMVQCNLPQLPEPPDVADAIAIALCAARRITSGELARC